jgi:general secretion pathway protein E/type IV pilus assembly protein PilB
VRDRDTAIMALRAAMTGHLVFTTLHTNDAIGAVPRLTDLGLDPSMIAGNVVAVLAQRLARKLCTRCKTMRPARADECRVLGVDPDEPPSIGEPVGCEACRQTGYKGRIPLVEVLTMDDELDEIVASGGTRAKLKAAALARGYRTMADDGIDRVLSGDISLAALIRTVDLTTRL